MCMMKQSDTSDIRNDLRRDYLYIFLLENGDQWVSQEDIYYAMHEEYPDWTFGQFHDSTARHMITEDIRAINADHAFEKMIIHGSKGVKIATKDEADRFIKSQTVAVFKKLKRIRTLAQKANLDGQYQLFDDKVIDAFLEEESA